MRPLKRTTSLTLAMLLALALTLTACAPAPTASGPTGGVPTSTPGGAGSPTTTPEPTTVWPDAISGFKKPTAIVAPDDGSDRLFVTEQAGRIRVIENGVLVPTPALDIRSQVGSGGNEQGLLGLAFPPDYAEKGYAYLDFTDRNGDTRICRVRVSASDPNAFDPASIQMLLKVKQPYANHNGGQLAFGPDGYLYIGMGDGGSAGDPGNRAQDLTTLLGKILRIDTESDPTSAKYAIPPGNPYADSATARPEIWLYGLRNPWRFSFDPLTGDLWIGDVGQDAWEEIDLLSSAAGGINLGWPLYEGKHLYKAKSKKDGVWWPAFEYKHPVGESVTGGYVYHGAAYPAMQGAYVFGDFVTGKIWSVDPSPSATRVAPRLAMTTKWGISTFGVDGSGELWAADWKAGTIHRLGDLSQ